MNDYPYVPGWRLNKENNKPAVNHSVLMLTRHGVAEGEWNGNDWVQYRWSCKVKDSDVLYWIHLEDLTQLEKEGQPLQQEQPEVDLDALVNEAFDKYSSVDGYGQLSVSFNRAELYSFIKKIISKEETK